MYWSLLIVASSMGNEDHLRLLSPAPPRTHLPHCHVFLAPSTIPGSACMRTQTNKTTKLCVLCGLLLIKICILNYLVVSVMLACRCICIVLRNALAVCTYIYSWWILLHQISSWYRSFRRTRFQKGRDNTAELDDTLVAPKHSRIPDPSMLWLWPQQDAHVFGTGLRIDYKPSRESQCGSYNG